MGRCRMGVIWADGGAEGHNIKLKPILNASFGGNLGLCYSRV